MLNVGEAEARAADLVRAAVKAGADAADVLYAGNITTEVQVRLGELEEVTRSESEEIGLRIFIGRRSASTSSSDLSVDALSGLVERALAMAREAPEDPFAGLAPEERLYRDESAEMELDDGSDPSAADLRALALEMEEVARAVEGITNSEGAGASAGRSTVALATSHGFARGYGTSHHDAGVSVIAGSGADMQRDSASHRVRHRSDLDPPERLGRLAAERALARLHPVRVPSATLPILFDPRVGGGLVSSLIGAMSGAAIARRTSFLLGREGERIFPEAIRIIDDPHRLRGLRSRPFDGEGVATRRTLLVEDGRLGLWLTNSASARQLGLETSGHAARSVGGSPGIGATNVHVEPGQASPQELMAEGRVLLVTELIGHGVNPVTGDYSRGASGFLYEGGERVGPVAEITIAGNLVDMYATLVAADDLERRRAIDVPTLRVEGMRVAGA